MLGSLVLGLASSLAPPSPVPPTSLASRPPVQVNVDGFGRNIPGDAANEPSLAVDPAAPNRLVVAWRQFGSLTGAVRTAGWATSDDGGRTWTFHGSIGGEVFRTDPVVAAAGNGRFMYYGLAEGYTSADLFRTVDAGATWLGPVAAFGGDKPWMTVDPEINHVYAVWSDSIGCCEDRVFTRSTDGGLSFSDPVAIGQTPVWGSMTVGLDGELLITGVLDIGTLGLARSNDARDPLSSPTFQVSSIDPGGSFFAFFIPPNPEGLPGMVWVAVDRSDGPYRGSVYVLSSLDPPGPDPLDVLLFRSTDGGETFSEAITVHTDALDTWQWFGTLDVAPNGRVDVAWIENLDPERPQWNEIRFASSSNGGASFSEPIAVSPPFDSHLGWPGNRKMGDYMQLVSDRTGAFLAYAATPNGEQDVFVVRIGPYDCDRDGVDDSAAIVDGRVSDCDHDQIPDACEIAAGAEADTDHDGVPDSCRLPAPRRAPRRVAP